MTEENPSTIEELKKKLAHLEAELLQNFDTPEHWGTAELARHHARRLSIHGIELLLMGLDNRESLARVLQVEIFLRELGGEL